MLIVPILRCKDLIDIDINQVKIIMVLLWYDIIYFIILYSDMTYLFLEGSI